MGKTRVRRLAPRQMACCILVSVFLLMTFSGCALLEAAGTPGETSPKPSSSAASTPTASSSPDASPSASGGNVGGSAELDPKNQQAFDTFCSNWNSFLKDSADEARIDPAAAVIAAPALDAPEGAQTAIVNPKAAFLSVTMCNGEIIATDIYTMSHYWQKKPDDLKRWGAMWKNMIASVNGNQVDNRYIGIVAQVNTNVPNMYAAGEEQNFDGPLVENNGWSYQMSGEDYGYDFERRVRACMTDYAAWLDAPKVLM